MCVGKSLSTEQSDEDIADSFTEILVGQNNPDLRMILKQNVLKQQKNVYNKKLLR